MNAVVLFLLLFQNVDHVPAVNSSSDALSRELQLRDAATLRHPESTEESTKAFAAAHDQASVKKFNALITKLMDFADAYKNKQAIDVKKAKEIRKAWLDLEKAEALFREDPKK